VGGGGSNLILNYYPASIISRCLTHFSEVEINNEKMKRYLFSDDQIMSKMPIAGYNIRNITNLLTSFVIRQNCYGKTLLLINL
jgi:hypothetical protein